LRFPPSLKTGFTTLNFDHWIMLKWCSLFLKPPASSAPFYLPEISQKKLLTTFPFQKACQGEKMEIMLTRTK